ncbi:hypothetical protein BWQ96_09242 [Gracilariopsis chorda]|uniref:Uncharacterized protein n=1 Tax=Gracilariopsis chorda TaxID=448386 RepID=A0A2V3IG46_9FLOR|nr:hypothetical protein BWQ96_09242 [Gracilariopsis chorda]|eukprot:PXF41047.1 hypothetical protein BWQ96_09242 [Gracilariopsis chorda]
MGTDECRKNSSHRSKYTATEDLVIVREVAAAKAHIAPYGKTRALDEIVADRCNENPVMTCKLKWKQCQDRYDRLQESFDKGDGLTHLRFGIKDEELGELNELLSQMREDKDELKKQKHPKNEKGAKEEKEKERIRKAFVTVSLSKKNKLSVDYRSNEEGFGIDSGGIPKYSNKRRMVRGGGIGGKLAAFGESLKESDMARVDSESEQLKFERHRFDVENK